MTSAQLIAFEERVVAAFEQGLIRSPVHLDNGNENQLLQVFDKYVGKRDWVLGSWRMHYKCLLHGVPESVLYDAILAGKSIGLCFPEYRIVSSAIVGGVLPIALGIAMGIKRDGAENKVVCFLGDMTAETGIFHECLKYSRNFDLPVLWVIEDNNLSVCSNTSETWGTTLGYSGVDPRGKYIRYAYTSKYPHAGTGKRIEF